MREKIAIVNDIINRGAEVKADQLPKSEWTVVGLRIPRLLLKEIDIEVRKRIGMNRNAWLLEIIQKNLKLERE